MISNCSFFSASTCEITGRSSCRAGKCIPLRLSLFLLSRRLFFSILRFPRKVTSGPLLPPDWADVTLRPAPRHQGAHSCTWQTALGVVGANSRMAQLGSQTDSLYSPLLSSNLFFASTCRTAVAGERRERMGKTKEKYHQRFPLYPFQRA